MNLKTFFTSNYLFNANAIGLTKGDQAMLFFGLTSILLAVVFKIASVSAPTPPDKAFRSKLFNIFLTLGISETVWAGFRYQNIRFFGSRFVAWLIVSICLVWLIVALVKIIKNYSSEKQIWEKEQVKAKYLPK